MNTENRILAVDVEKILETSIDGSCGLLQNESFQVS